MIQWQPSELALHLCTERRHLPRQTEAIAFGANGSAWRRCKQTFIMPLAAPSGLSRQMADGPPSTCPGKPSGVSVPEHLSLENVGAPHRTAYMILIRNEPGSGVSL